MSIRTKKTFLLLLLFILIAIGFFVIFISGNNEKIQSHVKDEYGSYNVKEISDINSMKLKTAKVDDFSKLQICEVGYQASMVDKDKIHLYICAGNTGDDSEKIIIKGIEQIGDITKILVDKTESIKGDVFFTDENIHLLGLYEITKGNIGNENVQVYYHRKDGNVSEMKELEYVFNSLY